MSGKMWRNILKPSFLTVKTPCLKRNDNNVIDFNCQFTGHDKKLNSNQYDREMQQIISFS
jgi:hypothetical protein